MLAQLNLCHNTHTRMSHIAQSRVIQNTHVSHITQLRVRQNTLVKTQITSKWNPSTAHKRQHCDGDAIQGAAACDTKFAKLLVNSTFPVKRPSSSLVFIVL